MADQRYLDWPFFDDAHRALAREADAWAAQHVPAAHSDDVDEECRTLVRALGRDGWLRHAVGGVEFGGAKDAIDTRAICLLRETLARHSGLADFAFAMQGLGSGAITLAGSAEQKARYLTRVAAGEAIAAFALSEPHAGSDVAAMRCAARIDGDHAILDGEKTWISNGGIADFYVVFARVAPTSDPGASTRDTRSISAFIVDSGMPGLEIAERIDVIAPASARAVALRELPRSDVAARGRGGRGFQARDAHARRVPHVGGPPPRWGSLAVRSTRRSRARRRARCSTRTSPTSS
jgi:acyl-CoA dehydrogenase